MIVIDTHIWVWWVNQDANLSPDDRKVLLAAEETGIGVPAICLWEVAMLAANGRILLTLPADQWLAQALRYPAVALLPLSPAITVESTQLPGDFHKDPADRLIVATARIHGCPLLTHDVAITAYPHVQITAP